MKRREFVLSIVLVVVAMLAAGYGRLPARAFVTAHPAGNVPFLAHKPGSSREAPTAHRPQPILFLAFKPGASRHRTTSSPPPSPRTPPNGDIALEAVSYFRGPDYNIQGGNLWVIAGTHDTIELDDMPARHTKPHDLPQSGSNSIELYQNGKSLYWVINAYEGVMHYDASLFPGGTLCLIYPMDTSEPVHFVVTSNPVYKGSMLACAVRRHATPHV